MLWHKVMSESVNVKMSKQPAGISAMERWKSLSVIVPALNEEGNLERVLADVAREAGGMDLDWEVIGVDDGSLDRTGDIFRKAAAGEPRIKYLRHERTMGVGTSFRDGVEAATKDIVTWVPGDGQNGVREILRYLPLMEYVDMIVPFVVNMEVRARIRVFLSRRYIRIINIVFGTTFNYTNGTNVYRRKIFENMSLRSRGFMIHTECVIKAARQGYMFAEVPVRLPARQNGGSKALLFKSITGLAKEFFSLFVSIRLFP